MLPKKSVLRKASVLRFSKALTSPLLDSKTIQSWCIHTTSL